VPGPEVPGAAATPVGWHRIGALFLPYRYRVAGVMALVLVTAAIGVVNPLLIKVVFDSALFGPGGVRLDLLWVLVSIMLALTAVTGGLGVWQAVVTNRLGQDVLRGIRDRLYRKLQSLSLSFFAGARTGELQSRISSDVGGVQTAVTSTLSAALSNFVTFASATVAMAVLSVPLTVASLATVPLFVWATRIVGRRRAALTVETQQAVAVMSTATQETLSASGITLSKLFGGQEREIERFERANRQLAAVAGRQQIIGQAFFTVVQTFLGATPVVVYLIAGYLIQGGVGGLTAGVIVAVTTLQSRLYFPVARMLETIVELQSARALFSRIFAYLDLEPDIVEAPNAVAVDPDRAQGRVAFHRVRFVYPQSTAAAIDGIDFVAAPGELVAFVGRSGAGKSSLLNLVVRLYDPTAGSVTIDGVDVRCLRFASLSSLIGLVTQEAYLFAGTLRDNIAYGRPDAGDDEIEAAARAAAIHDRITEFPDGYHTVVGERGFRLSGGERQRIAIARVVLHDPRVLALDEATSALDTDSERQIQRALGELIKQRTTLAVAHRLSTIQAANTIHVVDRGRIVETGTHPELLALGDRYARLYHEQFEDGRIEARCADGVVYSDGRTRMNDACDLQARRDLLPSSVRPMA
jgi:ATP-binding cassette, subfamily B, bacterial